ncbi:MAG: hypothetical protein V4445_07155 [Pseudomonadota bacterium]
MIKLLAIFVICVLSIIGCKKERQASAEIGAKPKQIIDKVTTDINNATAIANENLKAVEDATSTPEKADQ